MTEYKAMLSDGSIFIFDSRNSLDNMCSELKSRGMITVAGGRISFGGAGYHEVNQIVLNEPHVVGIYSMAR
jgi:hypothetical protein